MHKSHLDALFLKSSFFYNFISDEDRIGAGIQKFNTCLFVRLSLCKKAVSLLPVQFDDRVKVILLALFAVDFNLMKLRI